MCSVRARRVWWRGAASRISAGCGTREDAVTQQLLLLIVGFVLTSVAGGALGSWFQRRAWAHQHEIQLTASGHGRVRRHHVRRGPGLPALERHHRGRAGRRSGLGRSGRRHRHEPRGVRRARARRQCQSSGSRSSAWSRRRRSPSPGLATRCGPCGRCCAGTGFPTAGGAVPAPSSSGSPLSTADRSRETRRSQNCPGGRAKRNSRDSDRGADRGWCCGGRPGDLT